MNPYSRDSNGRESYCYKSDIIIESIDNRGCERLATRENARVTAPGDPELLDRMVCLAPQTLVLGSKGLSSNDWIDAMASRSLKEAREERMVCEATLYRENTKYRVDEWIRIFKSRRMMTGRVRDRGIQHRSFHLLLCHFRTGFSSQRRRDRQAM